MSLNLSALHDEIPKAVRHFWKARNRAAKSQKTRGVSDQGNRAGVTAGKNMDGFVAAIRRIIVDNGLDKDSVHCLGRTDVTLPGFYRATKNWDLLVVYRGQLIAAIEFKSQVGPSFGNNFNNRVEEALGNATDLLTAFREGVFAESPKPFLGYFFVLEKCGKSTTPVAIRCPHFQAMPEFDQASYVERYEIFCRKLVQEQLYDAAALLLTDQASAKTGKIGQASAMTSHERFAAVLAGKIAASIAENG